MRFEVLDLAETQRSVLDAAEPGHNRRAVFRLVGGLNVARLADAVQAVGARCHLFRHRIETLDGAPRLLRIDDAPAELQILDAGGDAAAVALIEGLVERRFRLDGGAPYQFTLLKGADASYFVFACHPLLLDRFSLRPLMAAIAAAYNGAPLPDRLDLPQARICAEEAERLTGERHAETRRFWTQLLKDAAFAWKPARLEGDLGDTFAELDLGEAATVRLTGLAETLGIGTDQLLLFAFHLLLYRLTGTETILTAYRHRVRTGAADAIVCNETAAAFRSLLDADRPVGTFLRQAARLFGQARAHSDMPMGEILAELRRHDPDFRPTNVLFDEDPLPHDALALADVRATLMPRFSQTWESEDIAVYFDIGDRITLRLLTRAPADMPGVRMALAHYVALLETLPDTLDRTVGEAPLFAPTLTERALDLAQGGPLKAPAEDVVTAVLRWQDRTPDAPALRFGERTLSYAALAASAGTVAAALADTARAGEGRGDPLIGLCLDRGERMIQAILGVLGSGAGYVPLDPKMPAERLGFIAGDAGLGAVITDAATRDTIAPVVTCPVLDIDALLSGPAATLNPPGPEQASRIAYVIYTSGTTGTPKGVAIERRMLAHLMAGLEGYWDRGPGARWMQFASVNFDASVLEIFNPLTHGGELVVVPGEARGDAEALFTLMREQRITHAFLPPALLRLLPRRPLPDLVALFCGGEAGDDDTVRFWSKAVDLANIYGPTEATVMATLNRMGGDKAANNLGRPIGGYATYLLDARGELAPLGGIGEICIGGDGVARGYLGRDDLTARKFVDNPFGPGRLYHTGDLGRFLPDGELEFLGRSDFQVKVRGFRIELGDITNAITEQPEVKDTYVGAFDVHGSKALVAWYVGPGLSPDALRDRLTKKLQHYMVPGYLIPLDAFPLNISGKIDRTRLPMPGTEAPSADAGGAADHPLDALDRQVRDAWAEALGVPTETLGPDSHFFHLGGHSLLVAQVCLHLSEALGREVRPKQVFEHPLLEDFCALLRGAPPARPALPPLARTDQTRAPVRNRLIGLILSRAMMRPDDNTYNIVVRLDVSAEINPLTLRAALVDLLAAHPVFRAAFAEQDDQIVIEAADLDPPAVPLIDSAPEAIDARVQALRRAPIDVTTAPLWRGEIHTTTDGRTALVFAIHHAIFDGWSFNLFLEELGARYEGRGVAVRPTIFDYCLWSRCLKDSRPFAESVAYWKDKLAGATAHTDLPIDRHGGAPSAEADTNQTLPIRIPPQTVAALKAFADAQEITLSPLLFALYLVWIWRLTGQRELVASYPYAGRDIAGTEAIYGMFVTMGFLRQTLEPRGPFADLAQAVHRQMLDDKDHLLATPHDAEIAGLEALNLIFSLQSGIGLDGSFGGGTFKADEMPSLTAKADLAAIFYESQDGAIEGRLEYDGARFTTPTVSDFLEVFRHLVDATARNPDQRVNELAYQTEADLGRFLEFSCGPALDIAPTSIPDRFAAVAEANPDAPAVIFEGRRTSFAELAIWSDRIASGLLQRVDPGARVGLGMAKSDTLVATVLGILKAGCAYVPLDPSYPPDRLRFFVENAAVRHVAADADSRRALSDMGLGDLDWFDPDADAAPQPGPLPTVAPEAMAYIIHTSGSTGQPKGVMIEHHSVSHLAAGLAETMVLDEGSVFAQIASLNFDASVLEMFPALLNGRTVAMVPETARKDPALLHACVRDMGVTHTMMSPVLLQQLPREPWPALRMLGFGGDVIDQPTADFWSRQTRFVSLYGPTEATVMASMGQVMPDGNARIIGKPLPGYRTYLLDQDRQPVPQGTVGEICIGGDGLARGYLNRDDLTLDRFVLDPFAGSPYARMYLTGDLGRFLADGTIEFFGRNDAQVKVRGFRIELGEIEASLAGFPNLKQVVCAAKGSGDGRYLAAYYIADADLDDDALRAHAAEFLPDYMIPAFFVRLSALPASPSGKVDRKALPEVSGKTSRNPPHDGLERRIADIWEDLLRYRGIDRDDSFFSVGGNSLLVVRMQAEVEQRLGLSFSVGDFYKAPTIAALADGRQVDFIAQAVADAEAPLAVPEPVAPAGPTTAPDHVLLTGAHGFLGIFLLDALTRRCARVTCLLRVRDEAEGLAALRNKATEAGVDPDFGRVQVVCGDLAEPSLDLAQADHDRLAEQIDAIVHCGAFVHHLYSYGTMKAVNVGGTEALLALALSGPRRKPFCYVSTQTVGASLAGVERVHEDVLGDPPAIDNGYILTKWVAEQRIARAARDHGLPAVIARPGNITGSSRTGYSNYANNHFWLFTQGCLQLGAYPDIAMPIEMMPVDTLAEAIAGLATAPREGLLVANLSNPDALTLKDFFARLAAAGHTATAEPATTWQQRLSHLSADNGLSQIKDFYTGDLSGEGGPAVDRATTQAALQAAGVDLAADYDALTPLYAAYLTRAGFLG